MWWQRLNNWINNGGGQDQRIQDRNGLVTGSKLLRVIEKTFRVVHPFLHNEQGSLYRTVTRITTRLPVPTTNPFLS